MKICATLKPLSTEADYQEALRAAADETLRHYQETGLHLPLGEVNEWMDDIIDGKQVAPLKCHK